ncbi:GerMN domain-containing protein [Clostridium rectalis]|uniref:GerMN domain-containing protein n=1 Tax=Clostridium rectalis TaxID=2040295 RepID=UPI000F63E340|nr:GerMN domain-containing protein [Clostridium rectalis]
MKKSLCVFMCSLLVLSTTTFIGCEKKDKLSSQNKQKIEKITLPNSDIDSIDLQLYFDSSQDNKKSDVAIEERLIKTDELLGELIMHELIKGPSVNSKLKPVLPKETRLLSFSTKDKIAYINLSKDVFVKNMPSTKEEACLKSIIWSLTSLPSIEKVKILVENKDIDTLNGNFDISKPLGRTDLENARKK